MMQKCGIICWADYCGDGDLYRVNLFLFIAKMINYSGKSIHITIAWNPFITIPQYTETVICNEDGLFEHTFEIGYRKGDSV